MFHASPKTKTVVLMLARRVGTRVLDAASIALLFAIIPVFTLLFLAATTVLFMSLGDPWVGPAHPGFWGAWITGKKSWISALAWVLLAGWIVFDATRMDWKVLADGQSKKRPLMAVTVIGGWGFYAMFSRFGEAIGGKRLMDFTPKFVNPEPPAVGASEGGWTGLVECCRLYGYILKKLLEATLSFVWGAISVVLMVCMLPLVAVEAVALWAYGVGASLVNTSWRGKAQQYADELLAEGAGELARSEAEVLCAKTSEAEKAGRTSRL